MSIPSEKQITDYLGASTAPVSTNQLYKAFQIKGGDERREFRRILGSLASQHLIEKDSAGYMMPTGLRHVEALRVTGQTVDGTILAAPEDWKGTSPPPQIEIKAESGAAAPVRMGDRVLARVSHDKGYQYNAQVIRHLDAPVTRVVGTVVRTNNGLVVQPASKKSSFPYAVSRRDLNGAQIGDLVACDILPSRGGKAPASVKVAKVLGNPHDQHLITSIALYENGLRQEFSQAAVNETRMMSVPELGARADLRGLPLVTIDGPDSRDFDDAVFAERTKDGRLHIVVAIADVAYYVQPGSALDEEAYARGNSTYFPDAVVPMLPERLSNDLCSLRPHEDRACMAVHMYVGADGQIESYEFVRGLMRSAARLTYEQVQAAYDGLPDEKTGPLIDNVIKPLYDAYHVLAQAREARGVLDLDMPERKVILNDKNEVVQIAQRERMDSHRLIEEMMILANVAAARALEAQNKPCVYRIHDKPDPAKLEALRDFAGAFGLTLPQGSIDETGQLRDILKEADKLPYSNVIKSMVLRTQCKAEYNPQNIGHFGLALDHYAHFTSPIRRYADLLVHRSLIDAFNLGAGGLTAEQTADLDGMSAHISGTERISADAERSTVDRFTASWLSARVGEVFVGHIRGIAKAGLFVQLDETGADAFIPARMLPKDHYFHDEAQHALVGHKNGNVFRMGAELEVKLKEANALTGSMICEPTHSGGAELEGLSFPKSNPPPYQPREDDRNRRGNHGKPRGPRHG